MPKFIIEREINDAGSLTTDELQGISQKSCSVLKKLGEKEPFYASIFQHNFFSPYLYGRYTY